MRCVGEMYLRVECYAGQRADERPLRFYLGAQKFEVEEVLDQWYDPDAIYFRLRAHDGNFYILRQQQPQDSWTLVSFRRRETAGG